MKHLVVVLFFLLCAPAFVSSSALPEPYPVVPAAPEEHAAMLQSDDPLLAANKRVAYDMYRYIMAAQWDKLPTVASTTNFINHNPNEDKGYQGVVDFLKSVLGEESRPIKDTLPRLVSIFAERDMVIMAFVSRPIPHPNKPGETYSTTHFDMFRIQDGLVVEHWDSGRIRPQRK